jgi:hypothetical protein
MRRYFEEAECYLVDPNNILLVFINYYKSTI